MKRLVEEFKEFALRGNVVDLAVGIVIGGAFGKITNSLVSDILMPPIGFILNHVDFKELKWVLPTPDGTGVTINYGLFINTIVDFVIVAFALFMVIKGMNALKRKQEAAAPAAPAAPPADVQLLTEIRDLMKKA